MSKNTLLKNIASLGVLQVANYVFPLISVPIVSRILGPDKFGVINYAAAFTTYFTLLIGYGFDLTGTRSVARDPGNISLRNKVFNEILSVKIFLLIISVVLFSFCLFYLPPIANERKVAIFSFLICLSTVFSQNWLFQATQDLPKIAILNLISKLLFTILVLIIVKQRADYEWQPLILSSTQIMISIISFFWAKKKYNIIINFSSFNRIRQVLYTERTIFFSLVVINLYTATNTVVLGLLRNQTQVGYYTAGQKFVEVIGNLINFPLSQALFPFIGVAFSKSQENGLLTVQRLLPLVLVFTGTVAIATFIFGPILLISFYGKAFHPSIVVFQILTLVPMIVSLSNIFGLHIMLNLKMDKAFFRITAIGAIIGLCLNFVTIHYWGYIGSAFNLIFVESYITITMYFFLKSKNIDPIDLNQFKIRSILLSIKSSITDLKK